MKPQVRFSSITLSDLKSWVEIVEHGIRDYPWTLVDDVPLNAEVRRQLQDVQSRLVKDRTQLMNEATIWSRAIYPLLVLAEQGFIQAWAGIPLRGDYSTFEVLGVADGVLGKELSGSVEAPYVVIVETKRGIEAQNPQYQLYGEFLAAAYMNWQLDRGDQQVVFGGYTVADVWTFNKATVTNIDSDRPTLVIESSREYSGKLEAEIIVKILQQIVRDRLNTLSTAV